MPAMPAMPVRTNPVAIPAAGWEASVEVFTPARAAAWLKHMNFGNRSLRKGYARTLGGVMERGEFALTPEPLMVDRAGRLLNGQHRLQAIVESGVEVSLFVVWDVGEAVFTKIDQGTRRRMDDLFKTDRRVQEAINAIARMDLGSSITGDQVKGYLYAFGAECEALVSACGHAGGAGRSAAPIKAGAALAMAVHKDRADEIANLYRNFVLLEAGSLPPSLLSLLKQIESGRADSKRQSDAIVRAFKAFSPDRWGASKIQVGENGAAEVKALIGAIIKATQP